MDIRTFLLNNASLQHARPRRRRHSIADVRFLHTLHDIPEKPDEEEDSRRRSTGSFEKEERTRAASEPTGDNNNFESTKKANDTRACQTHVEHNIDESPRQFNRCLSYEDDEQLKEAVSTYVLSYTDDAGNVCNADDVSPITTGSSSPQESSKETSDEELALSEMLKKVDASSSTQRSRRGSMIDPEVVERITSLTPIVESSRSSSIASVSVNLSGSPDESEIESRRSSVKNGDAKEDILGKILVSPRLTRRGSLSDVLKSFSPQLNSTSDIARQGAASNNEKLHPRSPLSSMDTNKVKTESDENPNNQTQAKCDIQPKKESESVLGRIMKSPNILRRRSSLGDVLRSLSPLVSSSPSKVAEAERPSKPPSEKGREEDSVNKEKPDGILGRIMRSPSFTRRGSIGNVLNTLSPYPVRKSPSPSPLTIKCDTDGVPSEKSSPICPQTPKSPSGSRPKGLLAIVQKHVINHSQAMQRKRRNSIASTKPSTGTLELSLRESLDIEELGPKNDSVSSCTSSVITPIKDPSPNKSNRNNNNNNNNTELVNVKRSNPEDGTQNSNRPDAVLSHEKQDTGKPSSPTDYSKSKERPHTSAKQTSTSPVPRKLVGSESMDVPREQSDVSLVKNPQRKISAPLPPRNVDPPQRKSSVNVIKRSPITFVISNDKSDSIKGKGNALENQPINSVNFANSRFLPLSQQEAEEYSRIKKAEASKPPAVNSTVTMSSRVTVYGGNASGSPNGVMRKLGTAVKQPLLSDSLPTEERFAALSERYASLKAKLGASDSKMQAQDSPPKLDQQRNESPNTDDKLTQSKCWTTVESIPVQSYEEKVSDNSVELTGAEIETSPTVQDGGTQGTEHEESGMNRGAISNDSEVDWNKKFIETITSMNGIDNGSNIDANNNTNTSMNTIEVEDNGLQNSSSLPLSKTTLNSRPASPGQRSRTSVVAKLMNRKMGPRRKQSIVPRAAQRQSKVYTEKASIGDNGIPMTAGQFEKIRALVENTVLRAPVRQEALTIQQLLNGLSSCLSEAELVAICKECSKTLRTLDALGSLPSYVSLESVIINPSGTIKFKHLNTGISIDDLYLAPEYSNKFPSEKTCVFSLAATLWSAADWRLTEAQKPLLGPRFHELLVSMTDDAPDARPGLQDVLQKCESLQTEGDMTSRERCQALLWEYQASAAIDNDDTTKRKTAEEDKKHHDTLMGSISVAASFKGFLKQTTKPQERNPFVKAQNNQEPSFGEILTKKTIPKPEKVNAEQNTVAENSQTLKVTSSNSSNDKEIPSSGSTTNKPVTSSDANNNKNPAIERKRGYSLTEDQKEQLLSLLASANLNKNPLCTGDDEHKREEPKKPVEEQPIKPPSPSLYPYPHYGQTDGQMMFSPITPAGRSASPSMHSDISDNQMPSVPNATYVPIAVPIPSVAPVPMPPFWYMPQGGMMPYPQQVMPPMPYVPNDASVASNQSVVSTDSEPSEVSDMDPRSKKTSSPMPRFDKSEISKSDSEQSMRRSPVPQNIKGSKLPRPIWQTPVAKGRTTSVKSEANTSVVRRRVPFSGEQSDRREEVKPVRARTPSPSLGRRTASKEVTPPRSQTPPVYWTREGVDIPSKNKPRSRVSTGSLPNWRPPSPSNSPDGRRRSCSSTSRSAPNSPAERRRSQSRPSSPAGSRSNSPVLMLVSKFEQMSQECEDNSPRTHSNSVSSMISKFGSSSLVPEDRFVKGRFKPNPSTSASQPGSKTGPLRPSSNPNRTSAASDNAPSSSWPGNPSSTRDRSRTSESSDDNRRPSISNSADPREIHRSGSDPGSTDNRQNRLTVESRNRLSSSQGNLDKESVPNVDKCYESRTRLLENIRKWTSQENNVRDGSSPQGRRKSLQERLESGLSLVDDNSTKDKVPEKCSSRTRAESNPEKFASTPSGRFSPSSDLRNDYIIKSKNVSENLSKPWQSKDGSSTDLSRKSSLDSEPVREKGSPRTRPRNLCLTPERDSSIQYCEVKSSKDFLWSPTSNSHKFEMPVDLAILDATTPSVSSPLSSVGGFDLAYGGVDGNVLSPSYPLSPGSLKDFKPSNYFTNVTFKCGEMEPERDTNCLPRRSSTDAVTTRRDAKDTYVKRFERRILRSTGDIDNEEALLLSTSGAVQNLICRDAKAVESVGKNSFPVTGSPNSKREAKRNPSPVSGSSSTTNTSMILSAKQGSLATAPAAKDSPRTRSRTDQIMRSRLPSGDSPSLKDSTTASRNQPSPMTLRKLVSNPLPQNAKTPQTRTSSSKRNSLPTSEPINLLGNHNPSNFPESRPLGKSSSQTNLSPSQKQVNKSSSHNNLSVRQTAEESSSNSLGKGSVLDQRKDNGNYGKSNPHSKTVSTNNPHRKQDDLKTKSSKTNTNPKNPHPSKDRHGSNERSKERNPNSSNPHPKASKTISASSNASEPSPVRYPYTRRGSTPAVKGNPTLKPPPKAASNPTSPLYPKQPKGHMQFFGAAGATYPGNQHGSMNALDTNCDQKELRELQHNQKSRQRCQSSGESSSGAGKGDLTNPLKSILGSSSGVVDNPVDSDVFYIPPSQENRSKSGPSSGKTSKRFPSSSSSDSGFINMSDPDETRKSKGSYSKSNPLKSPPTSPNALSPPHSPSPTSPKFPIGSSIFYDPKDKQNLVPSPEKGSNTKQKEAGNVALLSNSVPLDNASSPFKTSSAKSNESPNKTTRNDSDKLKHVKGDVSKITDKRSIDSSESATSHREKPRDVPATVKAAAQAHTGKPTSKEYVASSTPPPDIAGKLSGKSSPFSPRVDSKELLGQLVKKVLNSAAAKQGSSPKTSFAESATSSTKENGKGSSPQGKMFFLPDETVEAQEKEKTNRQGQNKTANNSKPKSRLSDTEQGLLGEKETTPVRKQEETAAAVTSRSVTNSEASISPSSSSKTESSSPEVLPSPGEKSALSKIIDMIHDEFAFDGYMDDGVEDVNMAEYVLSLAGMSEENFKEAITDQYSDLYWDEDLLHEMYEAVTGGKKTRRPTLQFSESTVSDISPPESISLSREESYLSLGPLYFNSISRSSSERSGTGTKDILVSPLGEATEFLPVKVIAPEMQADIQELLTPIFEDYQRVMGVKLASSLEDLTEKLGTKIMEISQQLMLERRAKKKSMNSYNKMADVDNKKDVKDLATKLVNEIEECDKKIIYLKNVQRQLRNVYAERFGLDTTLLYSFLVSYNKSSVALAPELNNNFLNFSPIWNQRVNESTDIVDESLVGPSLQSGTKLGLFSYLFDRHAMSQAYVRYFLYTFRYIATAQELFTFIREKCSSSLRTDSSGQVYNHQLQIRYRALDLLSEWIDGYYQFDFKTNPSLIKELLSFVKDELILVDRSERGHYLMELIADKQKRDLNNNSSSDEPSDFVAVLQLEDPQSISPVDGKKESPRKPMGSRKTKSPVQCFRRATPEKETTYKPTLYLKALSVLDHSSRILAEQLTLIQQDLFFNIHPVHFLNSRAHGIGVGRSQSPTRERDNIFGFSTGSRRVPEMPGSTEGPHPWENNMYASEPNTDGLLGNLLEHAQDVSLWVAVEICSASSIKAQLALITKFVNAARYCCEIRNYSTCIQIIDALEMFVIRNLPVWKQVPTKTSEALEELKAVKVLLKTDSSWLMKSESSRDKPTIPCFLLFVIHVQQQELGGFTLPNDMFKWTKMRSAARLVDQIRLFKQMRYAFQTDDELKERLKQRISECKKENLHALASENASNFHLSSSHGSRKFHDAFKKMKATFGGHN